jgi:hypothetical protein
MDIQTTLPTAVGDMAETKRSFEHWRRGGKRRGRIPEPLWRLAVGAASIHGLHTTARRLRLNATRRKEQMERLARGPASEDEPRFVELSWPGAALAPECILEVEDRSGKKLRIQLKGSATAQAASLGRMLWTGEE